jgi:prevent-host-death family protein
LAVLERVRRTNQPIRVTRFGKPVAEIIPPSPPERPRRRVGIRQGGHIVGDIVGPVADLSDWEVEQEDPPGEKTK